MKTNDVTSAPNGAIATLDLMNTLASLVSKGAIRQLDFQFARFIYAQAELQENSQALAFIAGVASSELGKGHICLPLFDSQGQPVDLASKLGLFGEPSLTLNVQLQGINWVELLQASPLVGKQGEALPMMFDGDVSTCIVTGTMK